MALAKRHSLTSPERAARKAAQPAPVQLAWGEPSPTESGGSRTRMLIEGASHQWTDLLALVTECGYGLTVSATRDGGALSLSLLTDAGPQKRYAGHPDELESLLTQLRAYLTQIRQGQMVLPGT